MGRSRNPFLADPRGQHHGPVAGGTESFPGFHTASSASAVAPYAQQKAVEHVAEKSCGKCKRPPCSRCVPLWTIPDYPVIVGVDMSGLEPAPDYDAVVLAMGALKTAAAEALKEEDPYHYLDNMLDFDPEDLPDSVMGLLFRATTSCVEDPGRCLTGLIEKLDDKATRRLLRQVVKGGEKASEIAMSVIGQYRYEADVSDNRIVSVAYMKPFWPEVVGESVNEAYVDAIKAAGWDVIAEGFEDDVDPEIVAVWELEGRQGSLFDDESRVEWHGTSYRNLLLAAPWLADELPAPPRPFRQKIVSNPDGPFFSDSESPLDYHGHTPRRLAVVDPTAPPPPNPKETYFVERTKKITHDEFGEELDEPEIEVTPGAAPGVVAFVDYDLRPGYDAGKAGKGMLSIHYVATRRDQRGRGYMKKLLDELISRHLDYGYIDFGDVHSESVWHYIDGFRSMWEREGRWLRARKHCNPPVLDIPVVRFRVRKPGSEASAVVSVEPSCNGKLVAFVDALEIQSGYVGSGVARELVQGVEAAAAKVGAEAVVVDTRGLQISPSLLVSIGHEQDFEDPTTTFKILRGRTS